MGNYNDMSFTMWLCLYGHLKSSSVMSGCAIFSFGPFEWTWRSLTYWKRQPFVKKKKLETSLLEETEVVTLQDIQQGEKTQTSE